MNHQQVAFRRKVIYLAIMAGLLLPMSVLGLPHTGQPPDVPADKSFWQVAQDGHILASLRQQNRLTQASLGQIDPKSQTMTFACLGFRGLGATFLWHAANEHKKK